MACRSLSSLLQVKTGTSDGRRTLECRDISLNRPNPTRCASWLRRCWKAVFTRSVGRRHRTENQLSDQFSLRCFFSRCRFCHWLRLNRRGQFKPEFTPVDTVGLYANPAAHTLDSLAHDSQADAVALVLLIRMQALKDSEKPMLVLRFNANTVILEEHSDMAVITFRPDLASGHGIREDKLARIAEEIGDRLHERRLVAHDFAQVGRDLDSAGERLNVWRLLDDVAHKRIQLDRPESDLASAQPAVRKNLADHAVHAGTVAHDPLQVILAGGVQPVAVILQ